MRRCRRRHGLPSPGVSIHALLAECDRVLAQVQVNSEVSIHALLAECDTRQRPPPRRYTGFNPRTPCGVRPTPIASTLNPVLSFNPRTPCGVRLHVPGPAGQMLLFQSTHSLRSATGCKKVDLLKDLVSIHALLAECDNWLVSETAVSYCFNPRTPCGVRLPTCRSGHSMRWFQSTHSLRSATPSCYGISFSFRFQSTHSLRSATAPDHIHCYSTAQTILCANLPKKAIIT